MINYFKENNFIERYSKEYEGNESEIVVKYSNGEVDYFDISREKEIEDGIKRQFYRQRQWHYSDIKSYIYKTKTALAFLAISTLSVASSYIDNFTLAELFNRFGIIMGVQAFLQYASALVLLPPNNLNIFTNPKTIFDIADQFKKYELYYQYEDMIKNYFNSKEENFLDTEFNGDINSLDSISSKKLSKILDKIL